MEMLELGTLIVMVVMGAAGILWLVLYKLANFIKPLRKLYCNIGWHCHSRDFVQDYTDGVFYYCHCKWCGAKGKMDSNGNFYED